MVAPRGIEALDECGPIIRGTEWFNQYEVSLLCGYRAMLNTAWNDEHFSRSKVNIAIAHLDGDVALEYQEEVVCFFVLMPIVRANSFGNHDFIAIEACNRCWLP